MADVTIYGFAQSTFVRTACMACVEKGATYERIDMRPHSPELLAHSPTGKMPAFRHGGVHLWETSAITRYVDATFPGPRLQPEDRNARIQMELWISMIADSFDKAIVRRIVLPRAGFIPADEADIRAAAERTDQLLAIAEQTLEQRTWLAGEQLTLADLYLAPIVFWLEKMPEGQALLPKYPAIQRWYQAMTERESFEATIPPMPGQSEAA
jgi:glutathione S-transferase